LALNAASYVFLIPDSIPYLHLRYGRPKIHSYPLSSFWGVAQTDLEKKVDIVIVGHSLEWITCQDEEGE